MKIVVIGATGNVGTALLDRLRDGGHELIGVARRRPDTAVQPYASATWHRVDLAADGAVDALTPIIRDADAVVHLAWAIQSNRDEQRMRLTNVTGTGRVLAAVAAAGVPHLVVASSVGAYGIGPKRASAAVDEDWPTGGIPTSHYSRHKAMNERALDVFEREHPGVVVTRMRPGLIFQERAGQEIASLFLGRSWPTRWVGWLSRPGAGPAAGGPVRLPILPLSTRMVFQAVHADDVAAAFALAIEKQAGGAFNIAADPVLDPQVIADLFGARAVPLRFAVLRSVVWLTWKARLQATDPGWLDIAAGVPVMSTDRARTELGWAPQYSSVEALESIIRGMSSRPHDAGSAPLRG